MVALFGFRGVWRGGWGTREVRGEWDAVEQWLAGVWDLEKEATKYQRRREIEYVVVWSVDLECCGSAASAGKGMGKWD